MIELKPHLMLSKEMSWTPCYLKSEADKEISRLKRELWLARAMRADDAAHWTVYVTYMHFHEHSIYEFDGEDILHRHNRNLGGFRLWCSKWENVKDKCLKKAKEYK